MNRRTLLITLSAALVLCGAAAAADKPDFSGSWKLNAAKSDFGQFPAPDKYELKIDHKEPAMNVNSTMAGQWGERTTDSKYTTDGKECLNGEGPGQSTSTLTWDGAVLVIKSTRKWNRDGESVEIKGEERWTLSEDKKVITQNVKMTSPMGEIEMKRTMEKQ